MGRSDENRFPRELLNQPREEWVKYFIDYAVAHPVLDDSFNRLIEIIKDPGGKRLVFVIGPTGAGKTFLYKGVKAEIEDLWSQHQLSDRGRIPVVGIEVPSRDELRPSYKIIYERLLKNMEEPHIEKKIIYGDVTLHRDGGGQLIIDRKPSTHKLRFALERALQNRRPYAVFLDEAQHLLNMGGLSLQDQMDCLKSIANMTNVLLVLFGTYEMRSFIDLSDQLMRRSDVIHFRRYSKKAADKRIFQTALRSFQINMPFPKEPDLMRHWEFFYDRTLGCIGNLYEWLIAAYKLAVKNPDSTTLTENHIEKTIFLSEKRSFIMLRNFQTDEKDMSESFDKEETYFKKLGPSGKSASEGEDKNKEKTKKAGKSKSVGSRKPGRDSTGNRKPDDLAA